MKMRDYERKLINRDASCRVRGKMYKCRLIDSVAGWKLCQSRGRERIYIDRGDDHGRLILSVHPQTRFAAVQPA